MNRVIEKLKYEENQMLRKHVVRNVLEQCEKEPAFIDKVLNDDKTLDDCIAYITNLARKEATEGCAAIEDNTVRGWAIHYFDEDELEDWKSLSQKAKEEERKASISKAETEKKPSTKKKETDLDDEDVDDDVEDEEEMDEKEEVKLTPPKPKKIKGVAEGQVSLFDW